MVSQTIRRRSAPTHGRASQRRPVWPAVLAAGVVVSAIVALLVAAGTPQAVPGVPAGRSAAPGVPARPQVAGQPGAQIEAGGPAAPTGGTAASTSPGTRLVLQVPGPVARVGSGEFRFATDAGQVLGRAGTLRRFRVGVEDGSGEDPARFAAVVDDTLGDERSWTGDGRTRLQRVPSGSDADFTVFLATERTAARMCQAGGIDITVDGQPYTSCRTPGKVIINLTRWRQSVPDYVDRKVALQNYRQYLLNHEVGHELGNGHEGCPAPGRPAPVMVQQTLTLRGCEPYFWPRLDGTRYAGQPTD